MAQALSRGGLLLSLPFALAACTTSPRAMVLEPSQTVDVFTMNRTESGVQSWKLVASSATLREAASEAALSSPVIDIFKAGKLDTNVRSESGLLHTDTQDVTLSGSVVVHSLADGTTLETDLLDYLAAKKQFKTDRPVTLVRADAVTRGVGMVSNSDLSEVHIFHQETRPQ